MAKPVHARRLTDDEGQTLLRIVRRGRHGTIKRSSHLVSLR
ncbi:hypothetical protein M2266_001177 [Streptomyces sp. SPB162]|nr:hypothetical protein [Streptomyces sp. SPB162]